MSEKTMDETRLLFIDEKFRYMLIPETSTITAP
jgi:hypothetical protein